jgi:hypothetical protein
MYYHIKNKIKKIAYEALSIKINKNYITNWMATKVLECINLKKEAFDKWLSSKQEVHKEIYKKKKKIAAKAVRKAKNKMWNKAYSKISCELGFKRSREAWTILKEIRQQTGHKTGADSIPMQDWYKCYSTLLTADN